MLPDPSDPRVRHVGHYLGTPPQATALAVDGPVRGRATAGMDTALLAYSGISIKMLVDPAFGANLLTMFTVDYEPGGAAQVHDHPFEEAYLFLEGEIEGEVDGKHHVFRGGGSLVLWRRGRTRVLQYERETGALDRDPGAATSPPQFLPLAGPLGTTPGGVRNLPSALATSSTRNGLFKAALSLLAAMS